MTFTTYTGAGELPFIRVENQAASAVICLMGAHVTSFVPKGGEDLLFVSEKSEFTTEGPAIRGGVPVCWPWFGAPDKTLLPNAVKAHGFARQCIWQLTGTEEIDAKTSRLVLELTEDEKTLHLWPHAFTLKMEITVSEALEMKLTTINSGNEEFTFSQALHTYFAVGDIRRVSVCGLDGLDYIDKAPQAASPRGHQQGDILFTEETDRIYLHAPGETVIDDPSMARKIVITKENSDTAVVWNPWIAKAQRMADFGDEEYTRMLCVEKCNVDYDSRTLKPGEAHTITAAIKEIR